MYYTHLIENNNTYADIFTCLQCMRFNTRFNLNPHVKPTLLVYQFPHKFHTLVRVDRALKPYHVSN